MVLDSKNSKPCASLEKVVEVETNNLHGLCEQADKRLRGLKMEILSLPEETEDLRKVSEKEREKREESLPP